nr:AMP-binding protein [Micromonospora sp. DSM 115978]
PAGNGSFYLDLTVRHRVTQWSGVAAQFWRLVRHPDLDSYDLSSLRSMGCGGSVLPPELVRVIGERLPGVSLNSGYGMTESTGLGTVLAEPDLSACPDSVGAVSPTTEVQIRDADGRTVLAEGEIGEIHVRGTSVFLGYWGDTAATAAALDAQRWYRTGDYGRISGGLL